MPSRRQLIVDLLINVGVDVRCEPERLAGRVSVRHLPASAEIRSSARVT